MLSGTRIPYLRRQRSMLTLPQQALYKALTRAVGPQTLVILTRVNLGHLVQRTYDEATFRTQWQEICRQWLDFVLCDPTGFTPVLAIKLETRNERRHRFDRERTRPTERDITEEVLTRGKIPLLRLMAVDDYDFAPVMNQIRHLLLRVLANEKSNSLMPQSDAEEIYIEDLDGEINKSRGGRQPPTTVTRSDR